jgi:ABC-2 type transport system permease protein
MTAAPTVPAPGFLDLSRSERTPFGRLVRVELRKMLDTRAGMWLLISTGIVTALVMVIQIWVGAAQDLGLSYRAFATGMNTPMGIFLPILGIMSVTSEWGQRTALTTFALEPLRSRLIGAKFAVAMLIAVVALTLGMALGAVANGLFGVISGSDAVWDLGLGDAALFLLLHVIGMATGFAFGTLFLNTAAAIVVFFVYSFVLPGLFELGAALLGWFRDLRPWLDFGGAQAPLIEGNLTGEQWQHLVTSGLIWFVLPLALGLWRVLRAEVK